MEKITVDERSESDTTWVFSVTVGTGPQATEHRVTVPKSYWEKLAKGYQVCQIFVQKSFEFLLAREPKESILKEFALPDIPKYFPEYETEIQKALGR